MSRGWSTIGVGFVLQVYASLLPTLTSAAQPHNTGSPTANHIG